MKALGVGALLLVLPLALPAEAPKAAPTDLEGTYTIVGGEKDGIAEPRDRIAGSVVVFKGNRIVGTDRDRKEFFACTYKLDTSKKPWRITMHSAEPKKGEYARGILEQDGDTVKLCYAVRGAVAPKAFATQKDQQLFVLKKK
jgi:uncharacterized protein (TIGR03067 family)